jgi:hypothetical protein
MARPPHRPIGRKLLVASIGVATFNYVGVSCGNSSTTGNPQGDASYNDIAVGNLAAPLDAAKDATHHDAIDDFPVANLVAQPDAIDDLPVANLVAVPEAGSDAKD